MGKLAEPLKQALGFLKSGSTTVETPKPVEQPAVGTDIQDARNLALKALLDSQITDDINELQAYLTDLGVPENLTEKTANEVLDLFYMQSPPEGEKPDTLKSTVDRLEKTISDLLDFQKSTLTRLGDIGADQELLEATALELIQSHNDLRGSLEEFAKSPAGSAANPVFRRIEKPAGTDTGGFLKSDIDRAVEELYSERKISTMQYLEYRNRPHGSRAQNLAQEKLASR